METSKKKRFSKGKIHYWIDVVIAIGFLLSAVSGLVLLIAGSSGGYQGGRNPRYLQTILFMAREGWKTLHNWSSLVMIAGVALHLALHTRWLISMTRNLFKRTNAAEPREKAIPTGA